jgi:predicted O-methyltransferase YrrM
MHRFDMCSPCPGKWSAEFLGFGFAVKEIDMLDVRPIGIEDYTERCSTPLSGLHDKLWVETYAKTHSPGMMVGPVLGQFFKMITAMTGARRILEIGMFTGYSTLAWAEGLPKDGRIITCEINPEMAEIARCHFAESPHGSKIEIKLGPALESLKLIYGIFDLCFIDADKQNYGAYYERCLELVRPHGLIILDKMLRGGQVLDPQDPATRAVDALNHRIRNDPRVENVLLPVRDGIMLARKL